MFFKTPGRFSFYKTSAKESCAIIEHRTVSIEYKRFTIGAKEFRGRDGFVVRFTSLKLVHGLVI
jgi:hypothetical protein